jgi:hypothetical protein
VFIKKTNTIPLILVKITTMKNEHKEILEILTEYLEKNECLRF